MTPLLYHVKGHPWGFFVTLTFGGKVPTPALAYALQSRWLDAICPKILRVNRASYDWLSREELGETHGRFHLHLLLGMPSDAARLNEKTCLAMMAVWESITAKRLERAGMARIRVFSPAMQGAEYLFKGLQGVNEFSVRGANTYELGRFDDSAGRTVRLARSLCLRWLGRKGNKYSLHARDLRDADTVKY